MSRNPPSRGFSLIEVVVFIVVLGIGFASMLVLYNRVTLASVDPLVRKQALAIASSLLEEIELRAFTYCDPDDPNVYTATSATVGPAGCTAAATVEGIGAEAGETRYAAPRFDNVNDYNGFAMAGSNPADPNSIRDITNQTISGLNGYSVTVVIAAIAVNELPGVADTTDALRINVTVTGPTGVNVSLQGYRLRYAPNSP